MEQLFVYGLKCAALLSAFFLGYWIFLRRETFFTSNRWYLLGGLATSLLLPLIEWKKEVIVETVPEPIPMETLSYAGENVPVSYQQVLPPAELSDSFSPLTMADWQVLGMYLYGFIVLALIAKLSFEFFQLHKMLWNKKSEKEEGLNFYDLKETSAPFSYFRSIVFNSNLYSCDELSDILNHERVHSRQLHSIDVLFSRIVCIVFWWNPFSWLYHKAILQNLEFIADSEAVIGQPDKRAYQYTLLRITTPSNGVSIINHFNQSLIKKRIVMLNKNQSSKWNSWKYFLILPVLGVFLLSFQVKTVAKFVNKPLEVVAGAMVISDEFKARITKNTSDEELKQFTSDAKEHGIKLKFSKVKRNSAGLITNIKVEFKDKYGKSGVQHVESTEPIQDINFFKNSDGLAGFGKAKKSENGRTALVINTTSNSDDASDEDENVSISYGHGYYIEDDAPDAPDAPEVPGVPKAPKAPNTPILKSNVIVKSGNNGALNSIVVNGEEVFSFNMDDAMVVLDDINVDDLKGNFTINGETINVGEEIRNALKEARIELKKVRPEIEKHRIQARVDMAKAKEEIRIATGKARTDRESATAESRKALEEARKEIEDVRREIEQARKEMEKARQELEKERTSKK